MKNELEIYYEKDFRKLFIEDIEKIRGTKNFGRIEHPNAFKWKFGWILDEVSIEWSWSLGHFHMD